MGFIKAALNAVGGTLADQYKEVFYCDSLPGEVLLRKGQRMNDPRGTNNPSQNVISDGSAVIVNEGQCLIVVDNGKAVDFCAEAGKYIYQTGTSPSMITGGFKGLGDSFKTFWERTQAGGQRDVDQRVYYVNMKEILNNKYGTGEISYRDKEFETSITIKCYGEYSFKIQNPFIFYTVAGNVSYEYNKELLESQMKAEIKDALQPAIRKISSISKSFDELPLHTSAIGDELNEILSKTWLESRGIVISSFAIASVQPDEESRKMLQKIQISRAYGNSAAAGAGRMLDAQATAFENASSNSAGALTGFIGMGSVMGATGMGGGNTISNLYGMAQQQQQGMAMGNAAGQSPEASQGLAAGMGQNTTQAPSETQGPSETQAGWSCGCGKSGNESKFCDECGTKKPEAINGWECSCGAISKGKFCHECGNKKPADELLYICDKCGWEPTDPKNPPKFCPECGDKFDETDIKKN